jgi:hypothetical protein
MLKKIFSRISEEIEKTFDLDRARNYLKERQEEVSKIRTLEKMIV